MAQRFKHTMRYHKTPRREHRQNILLYNSTHVWLGQSPRGIQIKIEINKGELTTLTSFCITKETIKMEKISYGARENSCKQCHWKTRFKMSINKYLSIITLNVNALNAPIRRHRVADWIKKQKPSIFYLQETHLRAEDTYRLKVMVWEKLFHANGQDR